MYGRMEKDLTRIIDRAVNERGIPGADCSVYYKHNEIFRYMTGYADKENKKPITRDTLYYLYSLTKVVTCTAALQLFERGEYMMYYDVSRYLPEFENMRVQNPNGHIAPARNKITIRDLFTMCAGLDYNTQSESILKLREKSGGVFSTREGVRAIAQEPLCFEPGTAWRYSLCHDVLAALVEVISGMSFGEYVRKNIFEPLGMDNSSYKLTPELKSRMAVKYMYDANTGEFMPFCENQFVLSPEYECGGAGLISSLDEYMKFADTLCRGGESADGARILGKNTIDMMRTNCLTPEQIKAAFMFPQNTGYGYGFGVRTLIDKSQGINGSVGEFGWDGAAGSYVLIDPEKEVTIVYTQHVNGWEIWDVHGEIRNVVYSNI